MSAPPIKVLIVDDSALARAVLGRVLAASDEVEVVGSATSGAEALQLIAKTNPSVVCTDLHMPGMDGLELTRRIMSETPLPILVISEAVDEPHNENVFAVLDAGAVDIFRKPKSGASASYEEIATELIRKIRVLAGVQVFRKKHSAAVTTRRTKHVAPAHPSGSAASLVVMGGSTGGPQAYRTVLSQLPPDFSLPLLCVQHIGEGFLNGLVTWLDSQSQLSVRIAERGEVAQPGTAYFAPDDRHLEVDAALRMQTTVGDPLNGHRPSITRLFESAARNFKAATVGVLLTGMGRDGAEGLLKIASVGGLTIVQDEASSVVFGMPQRAIELNAARDILPLPQIAGKLQYIASQAPDG